MKDTNTNANASTDDSHIKMNAGKMPAFQFYPGDWLKDPALQSLGYETQGIWMNILCRMHESDERGVLTFQGRPMAMEGLARLLGLGIKKLQTHLDKLLSTGVIRRRESDGALYNNRMVKDEKLRQFHQAQGRKGGNPQLLKHQVNPPVNPKPTPSSSISVSSSPSTSTSINNTPHSPPEGAGGVMRRIDLEKLPDADGRPRSTSILPKSRDFPALRTRWTTQTPQSRPRPTLDTPTYSKPTRRPGKKSLSIITRIRKPMAPASPPFSRPHSSTWINS